MEKTQQVIVLCDAEFGVWPDPENIDRATRDHEGAGDFPRWLADGRGAPRPTWFIKGNHEDFDWIDSRKSAELLPGFHYIPNGRAVDLPDGKGAIRVAGLGGCYGPSDYERRKLQGYSKRHYSAGRSRSWRDVGRSTSSSSTTRLSG